MVVYARRRNPLIYLVSLSYFLVIVLCAALLVFPALRAAVGMAVTHQLTRAMVQARRLRRAGSATATRAAGTTTGFISTLLRAHRRTGILALVLISVPPLAAVSFTQRQLFDFEEAPARHHRQIMRLLEGEQLTPPPALPPEMFTTRDVELARPATAWGSRDWQLFDDQFRQRLLTVFKLMRERHGYELVLLEGYRSPQRQAALAALGGSVTRAGANMSYHQYGLAADVAFLREGKLVLSEKDPWAMRGYTLYGELAEAAGLTWGGNWTLQDYGHVELRRPGVLGSNG